MEDAELGRVPVRLYRPRAPPAGPRAAAIFLHGGGWVYGSFDTYEDICRYIARKSESVVVSVGYHLAPEHKYPAAYEDCLNATIHFMKNIEHYGVDPANVIVCGDSAGGNLAAAVCQTLAGRSDLPKLRAQILIYPGLQALDFNLPSYQQNRGVPLLYREHAAFFALQYLNGHALHMQEVLEGSHVPPDLRLKYGKWLSPDNIPKKFKGRILEKTGLCSQITFGRYVRQGRKLRVDPKLFIQDLQFNKVPVRVYQPKAASDGQRRGIIFFHGGGWMFGSLDTYEKVCRYLSRESESVVVSVQYRLAPEHKYPAAYEDCLNATIHFMKNIEHYGVDPANVIVCGDSAGGNLAAAVCQTLTGRSDLPKLRAQILIYPGLQALDFNLPSYHQNRGVPLLFRERAAFFALQYLNGHALHMQEVLEGSHIPPDLRLKYRKWVSPDNIPEKFKVRGVKPLRPTDFVAEVYETVKRFCEPNLCPLLAEDAVVHQLPESFILTCEYDVLRDDGLLYKKRLEDNGVPVTWYHLEDGFHGIISLYDYCGFSFPSGKRGLDSVVNFLKSL
ncbi:arylacetamide deacetylase-like 4 [Patagioenas fasciata monilis]|uniref:Arylacetamide deacetylase-like 4 n=1 Tax=Patagioenas fasciata monilis TaxID=372326 RepID=A0A1V4KP65_PATFA|nr:arylacetamide deacetylase-like 4 [Patagioenas fasciata monilis]